MIKSKTEQRMSNKKISSRSIKVDYEGKSILSQRINVEYENKMIVPRIILTSRCDADIEKGPQVCITKERTIDEKGLNRDNKNLSIMMRSAMSADMYEAAFVLASRSRESLFQDLASKSHLTQKTSEGCKNDLPQDLDDENVFTIPTKVDKNEVLPHAEEIPYEKQGSRIGSEIIIKRRMSLIEKYIMAEDNDKECCDIETKGNETPILKKILASICILVFFFALGVGISFYVHH